MTDGLWHEGFGYVISQPDATRVLEADGLASDTLRLSGNSQGSPRVHAPHATRVLWNGVDVPFHREGDSIVVGKLDAPPPAGPTPPDSTGPLPPTVLEPESSDVTDGLIEHEPLKNPGSAMPPLEDLAPESSRFRVGPSCATGGGQLAFTWGLLALGGVLARRRRRSSRPHAR